MATQVALPWDQDVNHDEGKAIMNEKTTADYASEWAEATATTTDSTPLFPEGEALLLRRNLENLEREHRHLNNLHQGMIEQRDALRAEAARLEALRTKTRLVLINLTANGDLDPEDRDAALVELCLEPAPRTRRVRATVTVAHDVEVWIDDTTSDDDARDQFDRMISSAEIDYRDHDANVLGITRVEIEAER